MRRDGATSGPFLSHLSLSARPVLSLVALALKPASWQRRSAV